MKPSNILNTLVDGNSRFQKEWANTLSSSWSALPNDSKAQRAPTAIIVTCSDLVVPPEIIFDCAPGTLFTLSVAGNVVSPVELSSIEFAIEQYGIQLAMVLGHSDCVFFKRAIMEVRHQRDSGEPPLAPAFETVRPTVLSLLESKPDNDAELLGMSIRTNIRTFADRIRHGSKNLEDIGLRGQFDVVGAEFSINSGKVRYLT